MPTIVTDDNKNKMALKVLEGQIKVAIDDQTHSRLNLAFAYYSITHCEVLLCWVYDITLDHTTTLAEMMHREALIQLKQSWRILIIITRSNNFLKTIQLGANDLSDNGLFDFRKIQFDVFSKLPHESTSWFNLKSLKIILVIQKE